jgi:hypothetical protein
MTCHPRCGSRTPHPTRFQSSVRGAGANDRQYPWAHALFPIGGIPPPCTDPSYARGQEFQRSPPLLCHSLRLPSGAWDLAVQPGFPDTPCLFTGLSAGPVGHRQPGSRFPDHRRWGKAQGPLPHFRNAQPRHLSLDLSGSPNRQSPESTLGMFGSGSSDSLSAIALPVECGASRHFLRHPASPATNACGGHALALRPPAPPGT